MSRSNSLLEKASQFDSNNSIKHEVAITLGALKDFRQKYRFTENLREIEWLDPDKLFRVNPDETGIFFNLMETVLRPLVQTTINSTNAYRNTRLQIKEFKKLLRTVVDDRDSLAQKIDAPWERIGGFGQNRQLSLKIIYCFNYEKETLLPIFSVQHLKHFVNRVADMQVWKTKFLSFGQEYEHFTNELLRAKNNLELSKNWSNLYFTRFLYQTYPPPDTESAETAPSTSRRSSFIVTDEQLSLQDFMKLLGALQKQGKITGEQFRENRDLWTRQPSEREMLVQRLKKLLTP